MNQHALQVLQYPEALDLVARFASSPLGASAVRRLEPSDAVAWIDAELRRVDQMSGFLFRAQDWAMPVVPDVRLPLRRLAVEGSVLEAAQLRDIGVLMGSARATRRAVLQHGDDYPLLAEIAGRLARLEPEEARIGRAIDEAGEVRDEASRELARLRREIRAARSRIVQRLEQYMGTLAERFRVADASVTLREGRYVVPVRREGRAEVGGIVHDESATGATLFVEPPVAIEMMNRLREQELAEAREVQRILRELTGELRPHAAALADSLEALVALDSLWARARFALEYNGHRPEIRPAGETHGFAVVNGRHPILLATGADVVPFDLAFEEGERTLLVSGPNTGGKTVLLKAIGLLGALAQSGVIPPVGPGSRLPLFRDFFADIGDEQSIEASLSTFSAHLKNLLEIVEHAGPDALVLIDEIGSGTDPDEGAALARAILTDLTRRGTLTVATTHLGKLKPMASEVPGVVNASLQFDSRELRPTYRLQKGVPGRSYGLSIARRLGFPDWLLAEAESHVSEVERDVGNLLMELEEKERALSEAVEAAESSRRETLELRRQLEERESVVRKREREAERRARQQARDLLLGAREEVEAAIREVRAAAEQGAAELEEAARAARRRVEEAAKRQAERTPGEAEPQRAAAAPGELEVGTRVRISATGATGVVVELRDRRAVVEAGGLRLQVATKGLEPISAAEARTAQRAQASQARGGWRAPEFEAKSEIDLRGVRAEEVATLLHPALDAAHQADLRKLTVIHGKGTGALRQVVSELLRADRRVKSFRLGEFGEGGAGVTVVELE